MRENARGLVDVSPIDFHCHGIGKFDFTKPHELVLDEIEKSLEDEDVRAILTVYVLYDQLGDFEEFCHAYWRKRRDNEANHILGLATEGPLFSSSGGTPEKAKWRPTKNEWQRLAALGECGLVYVVLSPDAEVAGDGDGEYPPAVEWVIELLLSNGIKPALGHFSKADPGYSAECVQKVLAQVDRLGRGMIVTDHLFNDMPLNFRHAWRTSAERARRTAELKEIGLGSWRHDNLEQKLGPVPAAIIRGALSGSAKICLNFDGAHVDHAICRRTVELVGSENLILMTDRIQSHVLAGQKLRLLNENTLLYQDDGVVAGGTCSVWDQIGHMINMGLTRREVLDICHDSAATVIACH